MLAEWRTRWGLHTADSLRIRAQEIGASSYLIERVLPARSLSILLGDSGLGKSPWAYQAGMCVAAGVPFLGLETVKGAVVIADFENGIGDMCELTERISRYLGLPAPPEELYLWSLNDCTPQYGKLGHTLHEMLREVRPALAIVDSLGSYAPEAEEKNSTATRMLKEFRSVGRECGTATMFVHHRRKQPRKAEESAGPLESCYNLRRWFQDARGASALINGTDIRLGVDGPDLSVLAKDEVALVLRGFGRVRGEIGPMYLARDLDENGDPRGYRRLTGSKLLFDVHQEKTYDSLPKDFAFKLAMATYGKADQPTANFLQRCIAVGLLRRPGRNQYQKILAAALDGRAHGE